MGAASAAGSSSFCLSLISFSMSFRVLSFRERGDRSVPRSFSVLMLRSCRSSSNFWSISSVALIRWSVRSISLKRLKTYFVKTSKASHSSSAREHSMLDRGSGFSSFVFFPDSCIPDLPQMSRIGVLHSFRTLLIFTTSFFFASSVNLDLSLPRMSSSHDVIPNSILS